MLGAVISTEQRSLYVEKSNYVKKNLNNSHYGGSPT